MRRFFFHISIFIQQRIKKVHVITAQSDERCKKKSAGIKDIKVVKKSIDLIFFSALNFIRSIRFFKIC